MLDRLPTTRSTGCSRRFAEVNHRARASKQIPNILQNLRDAANPEFGIGIPNRPHKAAQSHADAAAASLVFRTSWSSLMQRLWMCERSHCTSGIWLHLSL